MKNTTEGFIKDNLLNATKEQWDIFLENLSQVYDKKFEKFDRPLWEVRKRIIVRFQNPT